jgi:hypothetical protein
LDDNLVTQIISRLGVDYSQAIMSTQQFAKETAEANLALQKLKTTASDLSTGMNSSLKQADQSMTQTAGKTQAGKVMGEKIKQDMSKKLLETEVLLRKTMTDAAKAGAYLPSGTDRSLGYINSLQQQVAAGKQLTQQEVKAVESIQKRTQLRQLEIKSAQQALALEKSRSTIMGHVANQEGRVGLAKKQNAALATAELAALNRKLVAMQGTVQTKHLENNLTTFGAQTVGAELATRQAELANLIQQLQVNGQLNAQEMQRLNLLKGRVGLLNADVSAGRAQVVAQEQIAREQAKQVKSAKDLNQEYGVLGSMAERRVSWFLSGTAIFGGAAAMGQVVKTLTQVESDMTTIARITEDVTFNFNEMRDELQDLGVEYGMAWDNVSDIAIRWAQAGYNVSDTLELTRTALLALNTAELDAEYACAA